MMTTEAIDNILDVIKTVRDQRGVLTYSDIETILKNDPRTDFNIEVRCEFPPVMSLSVRDYSQAINIARVEKNYIEEISVDEQSWNDYCEKIEMVSK